MNAFLDAVDKVSVVRLLGGEPLLYSKIDILISYLLASGKIGRIGLLILRSKGQWQYMQSLPVTGWKKP